MLAVAHAAGIELLAVGPRAVDCLYAITTDEMGSTVGGWSSDGCALAIAFETSVMLCCWACVDAVFDGPPDQRRTIAVDSVPR